MNAPVITPTRCDGCGMPHEAGGFYEHEGAELCGLCLSDVLDTNAGHEELEPDTNETLALTDRRYAP